MYLKKIMAVFLCTMFLISTGGTAMAAETVDVTTIQGKMTSVENTMYGSAQTGAMLDRINRLEKDYMGTHPATSMIDRVDGLYNLMFDNSTQPSVLTKLNAVEWALTHNVSMASVKERVASMEVTIEGAPKEGTYKSRIATLSGFAFGGDTIPLTKVMVPANTLIKIALVTPVNARNLKVGDAIQYQVAENVTENGQLIFAKGAPGTGTVTKVEQARNFGRDAQVEIDFQETRAVDGTVVNTFVGEEAKKEMKSMAMAAGASIAGMVLLGPVGIVTGAFVQGHNIDLPPGTEMYIQTKADIDLYGMQAAH